MKKITLKEYNNISNDYKGVFMDYQGNLPHLKGKKTILHRGENETELIFEGRDFIIIDDEKINILDILDTTYEDNTQWVEYCINGKYGYEIESNISGSDMILIEKKYNDIRNKKNLIEKKNIDECSMYLHRLIEECRQSENEMLYIEYEDIESFFDMCKSIEDIENAILGLKKEIHNLKIYDYIVFDENDCLITVYGDVITRFLF